MSFNKKSSTHYKLYSLSFIEGGSVMACELLGAKLLAPYFGSSLYVWASVLGITLGGLMCGYFIGGRISKKTEKNQFYLLWIMILAGIFLIIMPITGKWIMGLTLSLPVQWASILSLIIFMFPPLLLLGMASPLIINILTDRAKEAGNYSGNVYAISTLGGIVFTFAMGFYFIPELGIFWPSLISGLLLITVAFLSISSSKRSKVLAASLILISFMVTLLSFNNGDHIRNSQILYQSEGILGQIKVLDFPLQEGQIQSNYRGLFINNSLQTIINLDDVSKTFFKHQNIIPAILKDNFEMGNALILGMGGGALASRIEKLQWQVTAIEIDQRLEKIAREYFELSEQVNVVIDDARHVINTDKNKYQCIIFDLFSGEATPEHVISTESFTKTKRILSQDGFLLFNYFGSIDPRHKSYGKALINTLYDAGYKVQAFELEKSKNNQNFIITATANKERINISNQEELEEMKLDTFDFSDAPVLSDHFQDPRIVLNANREWREWYNSLVSDLFERKKGSTK